MTNDVGNYAKHAQIWDWGGYDRLEEFEYWCKYAKQFGNHVLMPFCALGEIGAYMAREGFKVTAFDITSEMIEEGKKRFGNVDGLRFYIGDVTDFYFDIPPADFCFAADFGHIHTLAEIKKALSCINHHLREGGALVIETSLPCKDSNYYPPKTFYPREQVYPEKKYGRLVTREMMQKLDAVIFRRLFLLKTWRAVWNSLIILFIYKAIRAITGYPLFSSADSA